MKRLLAVASLLAGAACASHSTSLKSSGQVVIVQIDERTLGSKDAALHQYPLPASMVVDVADKLKRAGARVVVVDLVEQADPTGVAVDAVQQYTGKMLELGSLKRNEKGQIALDLPPDHVMQVKTERGTLVQERVPAFATSLSFVDAYRQSPEALRSTVGGKIVYLGCTACDHLASQPTRLFADARLADQVLADRDGSEASN